MLKRELKDALDGIVTLLKFGHFTFTGPDWGSYGIILHFEDINPVGKESAQMTFIIKPPWAFQDDNANIRYETIVKIIGSDKITIYRDIRGIAPAFKWILKVYKACLKVNKMKVFL